MQQKNMPYLCGNTSFTSHSVVISEERITRVIEKRTEGTGQVINDTSYTYASLGQLLKEVRNGVTINEMTYDNLGNIKSKNKAPYTYGTGPWRDLLVGCCGSSITYDTQGNSIKYLGHTLVWEKGRQLKKYDNNTYTYNANGIRTSKTINGVKHTYRLDGTKILSEKWGNNTLIPLYNNEDEVCGIIYNGTAYYFLKNLQGDVISIKDAHNRSVAEYSYDVWGVCKVVSDSTEEKIADINPFRYRSYYYDAEIKTYYLQSRYYDPNVGRFINADDTAFVTFGKDVLGNNLFAYCQNSPVICYDPTGHYGFLSLGSALSGIMEGIVASVAVIKTALLTSWLVPVCIAAVAVAIVGIVYVVNKATSLIYTAEKVIASVQAMAKAKGLDQDSLRGYTVYVIVRGKTTDVVYVGMTMNYPRRKSQHTSKRFPTSSYTMMPIATGLTKSQARALEQTIITAYTLDTLVNIINSISPKK